MTTTNVNSWAMRSEIERATVNYNCGFLTKAEYANWCYTAREPYIGSLRNFCLWLRDRFM